MCLLSRRRQRVSGLRCMEAPKSGTVLVRLVAWCTWLGKLAITVGKKNLDFVLGSLSVSLCLFFLPDPKKRKGEI
jgi:hypothetical protein